MIQVGARAERLIASSLEKFEPEEGRPAGASGPHYVTIKCLQSPGLNQLWLTLFKKKLDLILSRPSVASTCLFFSIHVWRLLRSKSLA